MIFMVSSGPDVADPLDMVPIHVVSNGAAKQVGLTHGPWWSRLGIWLVRRYVEKYARR